MSKARDLADLAKNANDRLDDLATSDGALSNRNLVINGAMQVAQRGTSSTSANYQTVDRWRNNFGGVSLTQSQESLTSGEPFEDGFRNYLRLTQSSSSSGAADYVQIAQRIEGLNAATSGWNYKSPSSYVTASFWVRSSLANTYYTYMQTRSASGDGYINAPFAVSANTWTKVVISFAGNALLNIDNDNTSGIELRIVPYFGTNYTSSSVSSNAWYFDVAAGELPDFAQNWCATSGATFDITGVQLEVGDTATPFEHEPYSVTLQKCQRYYQKFWHDSSPNGFCLSMHGTYWVNSQHYCSLPLTTTMRADPTLSYSDAQALRLFGNGTSNTSSSIVVDIIGSTSLEIRTTSSQGAASVFVRINNSDDWLALDAEL